MKDNWTMIKEFYKESFGFPEGLVELVSVQDILLMCVSGSCNKSISEFLELDESFVDKTLLEWFNFRGFPFDLSFNPYKTYLKLVSYAHYNVDDFKKEIRLITNEYFGIEELKNMFRVCQQYYKYEDMIKNEWY